MINWVRYEYVMSTLWVRYEYVMSALWVRYEYVMSALWVRYEYVMSALWDYEVMSTLESVLSHSNIIFVAPWSLLHYITLQVQTEHFKNYMADRNSSNTRIFDLAERVGESWDWSCWDKPYIYRTECAVAVQKSLRKCVQNPNYSRACCARESHVILTQSDLARFIPITNVIGS